MSLINWLVQWDLQREARRLAKVAAEQYPKTRALMPNKSELEVIRGMFFDEKKLTKLPMETGKKIETCCQTVNGFCYMMALDFGRFKKLMNFRALQFTSYMDRELKAAGFPPQSAEVKRRILEAMGFPKDLCKEWTNAPW